MPFIFIFRSLKRLICKYLFEAILLDRKTAYTPSTVSQGKSSRGKINFWLWSMKIASNIFIFASGFIWCNDKRNNNNLLYPEFLQLTTFCNKGPPVAWISSPVLAGLGVFLQAVTQTRITGLTDIVQTRVVVISWIKVVMAGCKRTCNKFG